MHEDEEFNIFWKKYWGGDQTPPQFNETFRKVAKAAWDASEKNTLKNKSKASNRSISFCED